MHPVLVRSMDGWRRKGNAVILNHNQGVTHFEILHTCVPILILYVHLSHPTYPSLGVYIEYPYCFIEDKLFHKYMISCTFDIGQKENELPRFIF